MPPGVPGVRLTFRVKGLGDADNQALLDDRRRRDIHNVSSGTNELTVGFVVHNHAEIPALVSCQTSRFKYLHF